MPDDSSVKTTPCACCGRPRWIAKDPIALPGYHIRFRGPRRCRCTDAA